MTASRSRVLFVSAALLAAISVQNPHASAAEPQSADVVVYGGTRRGGHRRHRGQAPGQVGHRHRAAKHLGGLTTSGLGWTDTGDKRVIGGISREFYQRLKRYYSNDSSWPHEDPDKHKQFREVTRRDVGVRAERR